MGRRAEGWKLRQRGGPQAPITVRFTWDGEPHELSTGTSDQRVAAVEAAKIYAATIGKPLKPKRGGGSTGGSLPLSHYVAAWLTDFEATHAPETADCYRNYAETHWESFFGGALRNITDASCLGYMHARLRLVLAATVRQELVALRSFCNWLHAAGHHGVVAVPRVTKAMLGTPHPTPKRVAAPELEPDEIAAFLAALPEWSAVGSQGQPSFAVRARFVLQYETSLRPSTIGRLSVPQHWQPGSRFLVITREIDKVRYARRVPLTAVAVAALEAVAPAAGLIFGRHEYKHWVRKAAAASLPPWKAKLFAAAHLRSARITHSIEATGNLMGAQFMAGHKDLKSTARYARPSERAAADMLAKMVGAPIAESGSSGAE